MQQPNSNQDNDQEFYSINEVLKAWKLRYNGKWKLLYILNMSVLIPFLFIRYLLLESIFKYFRELWADQNGSLYRNKK